MAKIERSCLVCKKKLYTTQSRIKIGKGKYCSKECASKGLSKKIDVSCLTCNSLANGNRDFWKNYYYERMKNLYEFKY